MNEKEDVGVADARDHCLICSGDAKANGDMLDESDDG